MPASPSSSQRPTRDAKERRSDVVTTPDEPIGYIVVPDLPALLRAAIGAGVQPGGPTDAELNAEMRDRRTTTERLDELARERARRAEYRKAGDRRG